MTRFLPFFICIILLSGGVQGQVPTLKDSLLQLQTLEELKAMTSRERGNVIRKLRGQEPLRELTPHKKPDYDFYGVKIIENIPVDSMYLLINERIAEIKKEKPGYRQEVFPNAWRDVVDGFGLHFYNDLLNRVKSDDDKVIKGLITDWARITGSSPFSDFSRRIYYFDKEGSVRLITREVGYNIISGETEDWEKQMEKVYYYEERFIWNDSLQYSTLVECRQYVGGYPDYTTQEAIDTTLAHCTKWSTYHFKNNCFNFKKKEGEYPRNSWREGLEKQPLEFRGECENGAFISLRNLLVERKEYYLKENDYLQPVPTSEQKPYIIKGK
jgi:hypothetical protein